MNTESLRIAGQPRHAFAGEPWHGPPLRELLAGVTAEQTRACPMPATHSIRELVLHVDIGVQAAFGATQGIPTPKLHGTEKDWPVVIHGDAGTWTQATEHLF